MIPYATFLYFFILGILLTPVIILGLMGKKNNKYNLFVTIIILLIVFGNDMKQAISLLLYLIWQMILVIGYLNLRKKNNRSFTFYLFVGLAIIPLILVKITPLFFVNTLIGFLGVSYMTFKSVQVIIEIRDGSIKEMSIKNYLRFLLFFPTITSGPIDRYRRFEKDYNHQPTKEEYKELLYLGINKLFVGFLYKFIIGFLIDHYVLKTPFVQGNSALSITAYMYGYSLYLFFDFAGYSAFAIGISYILGIKTPENFNMPFISKNIKDFWNRWHMTLTFWFRDYIYMRFVFMVVKNKWIKNRVTASNLGYLLLFLTMGVWHGEHLHYILYGLYHALLFIGYDFFDRKNKKYHFWPKNKWTHVVNVVITFHFVCFGFLIFSGRIIPN